MDNRTVLITGASRGIGLEFARQCVTRGDTVFAAARDPGCQGLQVLCTSYHHLCSPVTLDLLEPDSLDGLAHHLTLHGASLDLLVHNAGVFAAGEEGVETIERRRMLDVFEVNVVGPLVLTRKLLPFLRQPGAIVAALTSGAGKRPAERPPPGGQYSYGTSKAALAIALGKLDGDLFPRGIRTVGLNPGFVQTDMTRDAPTPPPLTPPESVAGMLRVLDGLTDKDSGGIFSHSGVRVG